MNEEEKNNLLMNIQMFSEEVEKAANEGVEDTPNTEIADSEEPVTFTDGSPENSQEPKENKTKVKDTTKAFSERLKRERKNIEKEYADKKLNEMNQVAISRGFKDWKELESFSNKERLEAMGIKNTDDFENYVAELVSKNPLIEEARKIVESQRQKEEEALITDAINQINVMDPDIKSVEDLVKLENYDEFYDLIKKGYSIPDAYKVVAFDKITARKVDNATQNAITNANSKNHMKNISGSKSTEVVIPQEILETYHKNMPNMSDKEIREHYSKFLGGK